MLLTTIELKNKKNWHIYQINVDEAAKDMSFIQDASNEKFPKQTTQRKINFAYVLVKYNLVILSQVFYRINFTKKSIKNIISTRNLPERLKFAEIKLRK